METASPQQEITTLTHSKPGQTTTGHILDCAVQLVSLDDSAHQAHLNSSTAHYICPGWARSHRYYPVILLTCFSSALKNSRSHQHPLALPSCFSAALKNSRSHQHPVYLPCPITNCPLNNGPRGDKLTPPRHCEAREPDRTTQPDQRLNFSSASSSQESSTPTPSCGSQP
ncbi:unnamed protein product [Pleuronectes platessa]|uniref:Uncharacterized protein n=1 Tax=Pleuronectes platessa TaxID=8262 RepID=A0A9N7TWM7_PLEPL|nr:unnamed protein product [Pleuronectes platessa]